MPTKPLFAKRHYEFLTKLLRDNKEHINLPPSAVRDMLERFRVDNPKFNAMTFLRHMNDDHQ